MTKTAHQDLHSEHGARRGEHPGRSLNPVIKVHDLAWLEFEKPDLSRAEAFAHAFGFATVLRTDSELQLRGTDAGAPCVIIRRGATTRFRGMAFTAQEDADLLRLANATGAQALPLSDTIGGLSVDLVDPSELVDAPKGAGAAVDSVSRLEDAFGATVIEEVPRT